MRNEFFALLEKNGKELNHELVEVLFNDNSLELKDGIMVEEANWLIGQENIMFYSIHEAYEFLNNNGLLLEKYFINYHTGAGNQTVKVNDLNEAKEIAKDGIAYTQEKVTIETLDGEIITTSYWYSVQPQEDDEVLETVGGGFYQTWTDVSGE